MQKTELVPLDAAQRGPAAELLARAFHDDPLYALVIPDASGRTAALAWLFDKVVHYALLYGEVYTTSALEGVACWLPPGRTELTIGRIVRSGLHATPLKLGLAAYRCFDAYMSYADRLHHRYAPASHWYLWAIGVDPPKQGRGIGGRLIEPVLARASANGIACYLETGTESNVRFYKRHGFQTVDAGQAPRLGAPVWAMLRAPADELQLPSQRNSLRFPEYP